MVIVVDTNVLVSAMLGPGGASREVVRRTLNGLYRPLIGAALLSEYEAALAREYLLESCRLSARERTEVLDAFLACCHWTRVYYTWRPNSPDESDNHLVELAIAGGAQVLVTRNLKDFDGMELRFPGLRIATPGNLAKE